MRICFFGDSYVNGVGDPSYQGWVGRLCAIARVQGRDITAYNCGIRGATSDIIRKTWRAEADARLAGQTSEAVIFCFGANDSFRENGRPRVAIDDHMANVAEILKSASAQWTTLMIGPPGLSDCDSQREADHAERNRQMKDISNGLGVAYFDTLSVFPSFTHWSDEAMVGDGVHPGARGYAEMAEEIVVWPAWQRLR